MWKFLESEMRVILGLTEDAARTDAEIADLFGLKKGTVASVRRRLVDAGAMRFVNVPAFHRLGCEMVGFHWGSTVPSETPDAIASHYLEFCNKNPQAFSAITGSNSLVIYTVLRNGTDYDRFIQSHNEHFAGPKRAYKAKLMSSVFPFALSRMVFVPNFAGIVRKHFSLDLPAPELKLPTRVETEPADLNETEKLTLVALVENPRASDRQLASIVGLSRQAVTRIRNNLLQDGLFAPACIPSLQRWGFEICAVTHAEFNMEVPWDARLKSSPKDIVMESCFTLSKADESVGNYLSAKFSDYTGNLDSLLAWYTKMKIIEQKPDIILFSLDRCTELRTFDYGPAIRNLLSVRG